MNAPKKTLGQTLKESGLITEELLAYALSIAKTCGERLGDTLERLGFVTDQEIARAVALQHGLPYSDLSEPQGPEALRLVPFAFAQKHLVLPLDLKDGRLVLAAEDAANPQLAAMIARFVSNPLTFCFASRSRLVREIQRRYTRAEHSVDDEIARIGQTALGGRDFPAERLAELVITSGIDAQASDIHVSSTPLATLVSLRVDGVLQLAHSLPAVVHTRLVSAVKVMAALDIADTNRAQDGRIAFSYLEERHDLRVSTMPGVNGENLVIRILAGRADLYSLDNIGYSPVQVQQIDRMTRRSHGAVLVTGPTGSGKTTTLYAMLRRINMLQRNVLTVEDPVEIRLPLARQMEVNEKAGITFASAIRAFLRQDPDVILVGEVRDKDTAHLTLRAAQTGHLVLSTVHTNDAIGVVVRLRDLECQDAVLSASLSGVVAQRLVRKLCPHCRQAVPLSSTQQAQYRLEVAQVYQHVGCDRCRHTGYVGRVAVAEIIELDDELRSLIEHGALPTEIERLVRGRGVPSLLDAGMALVAEGVTDVAEIERVI
ncbi:GspE/PulE family protein [Azovibrio restrictus]|uniref:GspE/PulE family protein n=1 Tax=Azovibrio restrictus TaxID=146938 RepID=UPI0026EC286E|nr:type II/IV secretion system protein [Azovibrio restrictus]